MLYFRTKTKPKHIVNVTPDAEIEEWEFFDDNIYTPYNVVHINMDISGNAKKINFNFQTLSKEDADYYMLNQDRVTVYTAQYISLHLIRMLPKNYNRENIKDRYTKVFYDLIPEIKYLISDIGLCDDIMKNSYDQRKYAAHLVEEFIAGKFGIETESV